MKRPITYSIVRLHLTLVVVITAVVAGAISASAAPERRAVNNPQSTVSQPGPGVTTVTRYAMTIKWFDSETAKANGYEIRALGNGRQVSMPKDAPRAAEVQPLATVGGDCGYSYVEMTLESPGRYRAYTGFHVYTQAISYGWRVFVSGPRGSREHTWSGNLRFRRTWNGSRAGPVFGDGWHTGTVVPPGSYAVLRNGGVCFSGGPSDTKYLF